MLKAIICGIVVFIFASFTIPPGVGNGNIVISEGAITLFGNTLDNSWSTSSYEDILGIPGRKVNHYDIYDSIGIHILNYYKDSITPPDVSLLHIQFQKDTEHDDHDSWPKGYYQGSMIIDGFILTAHTTLEELKAALPIYHFEKKYGDYYWGIYRGIVVYILFDKTGKKLIWVSASKEWG
jgi:hypothetical protein